MCRDRKLLMSNHYRLHLVTNSKFLGLPNKVGLMSAIGGEQTIHFALLLNF
jgi:hypothetical protein